MTRADAEGMVEVFNTEETAEALVVKGLLEPAGMEAKIVSPTILPSMYGPATGWYVVRVNPEQAEEARMFIASSQNDI